MANDTSLHLLEKLLDARVQPVADNIKDVKNMLTEALEISHRANNRIDAYENKVWGLVVGMFGVGGAGGYTLPAFVKWLIGH